MDDSTIFDKIHEVDLKKTMEDIVYRLCHERYRCQSSSGCAGRFKAGTATNFVFHDRTEQRTG